MADALVIIVELVGIGLAVGLFLGYILFDFRMWYKVLNMITRKKYGPLFFVGKGNFVTMHKVNFKEATATVDGEQRQLLGENVGILNGLPFAVGSYESVATLPLSEKSKLDPGRWQTILSKEAERVEAMARAKGMNVAFILQVATLLVLLGVLILGMMQLDAINKVAPTVIYNLNSSVYARAIPVV